MIGVKNNSEKKLVALYDGKPYVFEPGVTTALSEAAARHIFGYGEADKTRALLRLGWLPNGSSLEIGLEALGHFQFLAVEDVKFKEEAKPLPRKVSESDGQGEGAPLSAEEAALLNSPEGKKKQFSK